MKAIRSDRIQIMIILSIGFLLRMGFLLIGANQIWGPNFHENGDTHSYTQSFINLLEHGIYGFDIQNVETYFGRLPGYPLFWGLHYLIFGEDANIATSISQILLDTFAIYLFFKLSKSVFHSSKAALISSIIYTFNPFVIIWTPVIGTESLATFFTCLFYYLLLCRPKTRTNLILLSTVSIAAFYTRPYLGLLMLSASLLLTLENRNVKNFLPSLVVIWSMFTVAYVPWIVRNYTLTGEIIPLKTPTAGYEGYSQDVRAMRSWIYAWTNDAEPYLNEIYYGDSPVNFPAEAFTQEQNPIQAQKLISQARQCGQGTYFWKHGSSIPIEHCNEIVANGFGGMLKDFKEEKPFTYYLFVPFQNLLKFFFKQNLSGQRTPAWMQLIFFGRSIILLLGGYYLVSHIKSPKITSIGLFSITMIFFIIYFLRQLEMRYLLQSEVLLLSLSSPVIERVLSRLGLIRD